MTLYLLSASQGEYSDRSEWACAVYEREADAQADAVRGSALWREVTGGHGWVAYDDRERVEALPQWAELKRIVGADIGLYDDLTIFCCEIEVRAASAGRNPKGEDREDGLRAEHEHAVGEAETPKT